MNVYSSDIWEFLLLYEKQQEYNRLNNKHDKGYKYLLSVKKVFVQLLRSFVEQGWVKRINEDDVILIDKSFILQDFKDKEADLVYKVKLDGKEVVFYILLELQSTVDFQMPYRLLLYMVEIWRTVVKDAGRKKERKGFKLPAIIPCVLYNGKDNWTVCRSFRETLEGGEAFGENILDFRYILFDVKRYDENKLLELANVIGAAFFIDRKPEWDDIKLRWKKVYEQFSRLDNNEQELFMVWFNNVVLRHIPVEKAEELRKVIEQSEGGNGMIYAIDEAIMNEMEKAREKGIREGKEEGLKEGIREGIREGIKEGKEETAKNLLSMGMTIEQVAKGTELPFERVHELSREA